MERSVGLELNQDPASRGLTDEGIIHIPGLLSRYVRLADGQIAHYVTAGEDGPAVILLHGGIAGSSGTAGWRFTIPYLAAHGFRVYAPDRPGFGLSDTSKVEYLDWSNRAQVNFVRNFADALGIDKFHISGNSSGCLVSYLFLISHPERVLSAYFIAGFFGDVVDPARRITSPQSKFTSDPTFLWEKNGPFDGTGEWMRTMMEMLIYKPGAIWPELIEMRVRAANKQANARKGLEVGRESIMETDPNLHQVWTHSKGRLDVLTTPMICMYGLQDVSIPAENGFMQDDALPNMQFFFPDECGHQGQTDQPDMFNAVYVDFFKTGKVSWKNAVWAGVSRRKPINPNLVDEPAGGFPAPNREMYDSIESVRAGYKQLQETLN
jgi:pimeloyl-ACP methyl ester carboxylesterase